MAYDVKNYDGSLFATINDGTLNTQSSLVLVGKNWSGYGNFIDQDLLWLMQNFSNSSAPPAPVKGQLWWNSTSNTLSIYTGAVWKAFASNTASTTQPTTGNVIGDLWYNTTAQVLSVWNGSTWLAVGPSVTNGTGALATTIVDNTSVAHNVVEFMVGTNVVGIIASEAFTPAVAIPGFNTVIGGSVIQPGLNLSSNIGAGGTQAGTVTSWINVLGNVSVGGNVSAVGNVTGQYLIGNGAFITGAIGSNTSNVYAGNVFIGRVSANGSFGNSGQVLTSAGAGASAYWANVAGGGNIAIAGNTANATLYPMFANVTTGNLSTAFVNSTGYTFNPSTGYLTANTMVSSSGISLNSNAITQSYTIPAGYNGVSSGPITLAAGVVVTVATGSNWSIV